MQIREYKDNDKQQIIDLWKSIFQGTLPHHDAKTSIKNKTEYDKKLFYVAEESDKVIGTIMGGYDGHRGWIYSLAVHEFCRKQGIGMQLIKKVEEQLKKLNCMKVNLQVTESNKSAIEFYNKCGFDIEQRISMGKKLY